MPVILYGGIFSPPCRAVIIVAEAIGLPLEFKEINFVKGEHMTPEFLKMNPLHTIPTLDDNGLILVDSHAIIAYLVSKYGKNDSLYPKDIVKKALVDAKLHFDNGYAFSVLRRTYRAHVYDKQTEPITTKQNQEIDDVYNFTNTFLDKNKWLIGDSVTVADISVFTTLTNLEIMVPIDGNKYPNLRRWLNDAETLPYFKSNKAGVENFKALWEKAIKH